MQIGTEVILKGRSTGKPLYSFNYPSSCYGIITLMDEKRIVVEHIGGSFTYVQAGFDPFFILEEISDV